MKMLAPGQRIDLGELARRLALAGYTRSSTVIALATQVGYRTLPLARAATAGG